MTFIFAGIALNMASILGFIFIIFCHLGDIDLRDWISLPITLVVFIFLGGLSLRLTYISRREIVKLSLVSIPILSIGFVFILLSLSVIFEVPEVDLLYS